MIQVEKDDNQLRLGQEMSFGFIISKKLFGFKMIISDNYLRLG